MIISGKLIFNLITASKELMHNCERCGGTGDVYLGDPEFDPWDCSRCYRLRNVLKEIEEELTQVDKR